VTTSRPKTAIPKSATPIALSIAGSDPSGGAGIQADLKTFSAHGVYGCAIITALTAQNTLGVSGIWPAPVDSIQAQIESVLSDVAVNTIKIGMLCSAEIIEAVANILIRFPGISVICDPVMVATSGDNLLDKDAVDSMAKKIFPLSILVTPNLDEAALLLNEKVAENTQQMKAQCEALMSMGCQGVLLKGGHLKEDESTDILIHKVNGKYTQHIFSLPRIDTKNTHGTGCTLSSAICANLAKGTTMLDAVSAAKRFVTDAIKFSDRIHVGAGNGPVNHLYEMQL